jgi:hypothetical protein
MQPVLTALADAQQRNGKESISEVVQILLSPMTL